MSAAAAAMSAAEAEAARRRQAMAALVAAKDSGGVAGGRRLNWRSVKLMCPECRCPLAAADHPTLAPLLDSEDEMKDDDAAGKKAEQQKQQQQQQRRQQQQLKQQQQQRLGRGEWGKENDEEDEIAAGDLFECVHPAKTTTSPEGKAVGEQGGGRLCAPRLLRRCGEDGGDHIRPEGSKHWLALCGRSSGAGQWKMIHIEKKNKKKENTGTITTTTTTTTMTGQASGCSPFPLRRAGLRPRPQRRRSDSGRKGAGRDARKAELGNSRSSSREKQKQQQQQQQQQQHGYGCSNVNTSDSAGDEEGTSREWQRHSQHVKRAESEESGVAQQQELPQSAPMNAKERRKMTRGDAGGRGSSSGGLLDTTGETTQWRPPTLLYTTPLLLPMLPMPPPPLQLPTSETRATPLVPATSSGARAASWLERSRAGGRLPIGLSSSSSSGRCSCSRRHPWRRRTRSRESTTSGGRRGTAPAAMVRGAPRRGEVVFNWNVARLKKVHGGYDGWVVDGDHDHNTDDNENAADGNGAIARAENALGRAASTKYIDQRDSRRSWSVARASQGRTSNTRGAAAGVEQEQKEHGGGGGGGARQRRRRRSGASSWRCCAGTARRWTGARWRRLWRKICSAGGPGGASGEMARPTRGCWWTVRLRLYPTPEPDQS